MTADRLQVDFDPLLKSNLVRVFNERDETLRSLAMNELFVDEPVMYEPGGSVVGRTAISEVAGALLEQFGARFEFRAVGSGIGHHGMGTLRWEAGDPHGPVVVRGFDTAEVVDGRISRPWVFIDQTKA